LNFSILNLKHLSRIVPLNNPNLQGSLTDQDTYAILKEKFDEAHHPYMEKELLQEGLYNL